MTTVTAPRNSEEARYFSGTSGLTTAAPGMSNPSSEADIATSIKYEVWATLTGYPLVFRISRPDLPSVSDRVEAFKYSSGLTWEQVARLFGVSKRAVMLWKAGGQMSAGHEERLALLLQRLSQAPTNDPVATRGWLLTVGKEGSAPYQRWLSEVTRRPQPVAWIDRQPDSR